MWSASRCRGDHISRLTIDLSDQRYQSLKALAASQRKALKQYAIERLFHAPGDVSDDAWQELKNLLGTRINKGLKVEVSAKTIGEILDEELGEDHRA
jgi:hypothetical protein